MAVSSAVVCPATVAAVGAPLTSETVTDTVPLAVSEACPPGSFSQAQPTGTGD